MEQWFKFKIIVGLFILGFSAACTQGAAIPSELLPTAEYLEQHPLAEPEFWIQSYSVNSSNSMTERCVEVNQDVLKSDLTAKVMVDGRTVEISSIWVAGSLVLGDGKSYAARKSFCFSTQALAFGLHLAQIEVMAQSGKNDTHTWAFRIGDGAQAQGQPTLAVLPIATP